MTFRAKFFLPFLLLAAPVFGAPHGQIRSGTEVMLSSDGIKNSTTLESKTFYVSSGTVAGQLNVLSPDSSGFGSVDSRLSIDMSENRLTQPAHTVFYDTSYTSPLEVDERIRNSDASEYMQKRWGFDLSGVPLVQYYTHDDILWRNYRGYNVFASTGVSYNGTHTSADPTFQILQATGITNRNILQVGIDGGTSIDVSTSFFTVSRSSVIVGSEAAFKIEGLDCSGNANGGALTAVAGGVVSCSDDDSGSSSGWTTYTATAPLNMDGFPIDNVSSMTFTAELPPVIQSSWTTFQIQLTDTSDDDLVVGEGSTTVQGLKADWLHFSAATAPARMTFPGSWPIIGSSDTYSVAGSSIPLWGLTHCDVTISTISAAVGLSAQDIDGDLKYTATDNCLNFDSATLIEPFDTSSSVMVSTGIDDATVPKGSCIFAVLDEDLDNENVLQISMEMSCDP